MVQCSNSVTFVVMMTSCVLLLTTADAQSVGAASFQADDSWGQRTVQQQQQQNLQHLQQQLSSRYSHPATDPHSLLDNAIDHHSKYLVAKPKKLQDNPLDFTGQVGSVSGAAFLGMGDLFRDKNSETAASFHPSYGQREPDFLEVGYPILDSQTLFTPSGASSLSPYLSAQEFKQTFRSDPYILGKRKIYFLPSDKMTISGEKRVAPKFVGKRNRGKFFDKTGNILLPEMYLADISSDYVARSLLENTLAAPKFGERLVINESIPYFEGKRGSPPKFVGKRASAMESGSDESFSMKHKRAAPKFVGRRGVPYFVGKRGPQTLFENGLTKFGYQDQERSALEQKRGSPKFVGKRGPSYFSDKRGAPKFVGKRLNEFGYSENHYSLSGEKRRAPKFVGKRFGEFGYLEDDHSLSGEKRRAPKFVGKRFGEFGYLKDDHSLSGEKRRAPKFVGKRFNELDYSQDQYSLSGEKRGAPKFVGRRAVYYSVGEPGSEMFVGKQVVTPQLHDQVTSSSEDTSDMYFSGNRGLHKIVRKWALVESEGDDRVMV